MDVKPKGFLRRLVELAVTGIERRSRPPGAPAALPNTARAQQGERAAPTQVVPDIVRVEDEEGAIALEVAWSSSDEARVSWSLREEDLESARALMNANARLTIRTVAFTTDRSGVLREASDIAVSNLQGELFLKRARPERLLVSVGLAHETEFRSVAHLEVR